MDCHTCSSRCYGSSSNSRSTKDKLRYLRSFLLWGNHHLLDEYKYIISRLSFGELTQKKQKFMDGVIIINHVYCVTKVGLGNSDC